MNLLWIRKGFSSMGPDKVVLITTAFAILLFSLAMFLKINTASSWVNKICEPRQYVDWQKFVTVPIDSIRRNEITNEIKERQEDLKLCLSGRGNTYCDILIKFGSYDTMQLENDLRKGKENKMVPDEERRAVSQKEVSDYEFCLNMQKIAKIELPEKFKLLGFGSLIILIVGLLVSFSLKNKQR